MPMPFSSMVHATSHWIATIDILYFRCTQAAGRADCWCQRNERLAIAIPSQMPHTHVEYLKRSGFYDRLEVWYHDKIRKSSFTDRCPAHKNTDLQYLYYYFSIITSFTDEFLLNLWNLQCHLFDQQHNRFARPFLDLSLEAGHLATLHWISQRKQTPSHLTSAYKAFTTCLTMRMTTMTMMTTKWREAVHSMRMRCLLLRYVGRSMLHRNRIA